MKISQDSFLNWCNTQELFIVDTEKQGDIPRDELDESYKQFCRDNEVPRKTGFYKLFEKHYKLGEPVKHNGVRMYDGIVRV